jgi:hypothetical protein
MDKQNPFSGNIVFDNTIIVKEDYNSKINNVMLLYEDKLKIELEKYK